MNKPTKHKVRQWLYNLVKRKKPPPSPEEIKRQLGNWHFDKDKKH